jgi:hypothetical protein
MQLSRIRGRIVFASFLALMSTLSACADEPEVQECVLAARVLPKVYYGTPGPTFAPLTPGQVLAVGQVGACSGTLIAPSWALSAYHCGLSPGALFCMGEQPDAPTACVEVAEVIRDPAPDSDIVLLQLAGDARDVLPEVEPIPVMTETLDPIDPSDPSDRSWLGELAEGAGYGMTEELTLGTRYFTAEPIVAIDDTFVHVDGEGSHGLCGGDSGGPLLVIASDLSVRVAGALYGGDASCVGHDQYSRVDAAGAWIESLVGAPTVGPAVCGAVDAIGMCSGARALYCADGALTAQSCAADAPCGWDESAGGFRCVAGDDPCAGYDRRGGCEGQVATWCDDGQLRQRDCAACQERCFMAGSPTGAYCVADGCLGLDFLGRCDGDVAEWCDGGEINSVDCAARGQRCGYVDDSTGYYCI